MKRTSSTRPIAPRNVTRLWATVGSCALFGACSLQDLDHLRDDSLFLPDSGLGGANNTSGSAGESGAGGTQSGSSGAGGAAPVAGAGGGAGSSGDGSGGASGNNSSNGGSGGDGGSAGASGTGGVGGAAGFVGEIGDGGPDPNVIEDPGFESGLGTWTAFVGGTPIWESVGPLAGSRCFRVAGRGQPNAGPSHSLQGLVTPGETIKVSTWVRTEVPVASIKVTIRHNCTTGGGSQYAQAIPDSPASNFWQKYDGEYVVPTCTTSNIDVYVEGPPGEVDLYIDEFRVEPVAPPI